MSAHKHTQRMTAHQTQRNTSSRCSSSTKMWHSAIKSAHQKQPPPTTPGCAVLCRWLHKLTMPTPRQLHTTCSQLVPVPADTPLPLPAPAARPSLPCAASWRVLPAQPAAPLDQGWPATPQPLQGREGGRESEERRLETRLASKASALVSSCDVNNKFSLPQQPTRSQAVNVHNSTCPFINSTLHCLSPLLDTNKTHPHTQPHPPTHSCML